VERRQLSVDRVLAGVDVARRGRGDDERGQRCESETAHRTKLSRRNGPSLLPSSAYEACGGGSGCGGDGSGVGSGEGTGIGGSDGTGDGSGTVTGCGGSEGAGIGSGTCGGSTTAVGWTWSCARWIRSVAASVTVFISLSLSASARSSSRICFPAS